MLYISWCKFHFIFNSSELKKKLIVYPCESKISQMQSLKHSNGNSSQDMWSPVRHQVL